MKINWFCPLLPEKTDIAHYTSRIIKQLRKYADVVLWTDKAVWLSEYEELADVRYYNPDTLSKQDLAGADINVYHIGNNSQFHGSIWKVCWKYPGIVVIHDVNLHYLFTSLYSRYAELGADQELYVGLMLSCHGSNCRQDLHRFFANQLDWSTLAERYPLTNAATQNALGVIVHTQEAYRLFIQDEQLPVLYAPLPYPAFPPNNATKNKSKAPFRLVVFGYLGGLHRRVQSVLEALGTFPEKHQFYLDIYGDIWDRKYIDQLIHRFQLENLVTLYGFVEEEELDTALSNADLVFNLRYPTGGEASGSQLRIWSHALPSLVTRIGWYAEIPENAVAFVRHDYEIEDIQHHLTCFLTNPDVYVEMGKKGRSLLTANHAPWNYTKQIIEFCQQVLQARTTPVIVAKPRVSVVIPAYNAARYLPQAIESVINQTYTKYEIIVVNDGSTDSTETVVQPYFDQIRYVSFQNNQGVSVARNRGIEMAKGSLVLFLDADDTLLPTALKSLVSCFDVHNEAGVISSGFRFMTDKGTILSDVHPWRELPALDLETLILHRTIFTSAMMFRREWLEWTGGYNTNLRYGEDLNLIIRMLLLNCRAIWLTQVTVCRRQHSSSAYQAAVPVAQALEFILQDLFNQSNLPDSVERIYKQAMYRSLVWSAWNLYRTGNTKEMILYLQKSLFYASSSVVESVSAWVDEFKRYSQATGSSFDAYEFGNELEWKQFIRSLIIQR